MKILVDHTEQLQGSVMVPPSKSHTHRAIILASLASGESLIKNPLPSRDCYSTIKACEKIGASITSEHSTLKITGVNGTPHLIDTTIDVGNSGTTLRFMSAIVSRCDGTVMLTGDESIRKRPIQPLLQALNDLGANAVSINDSGCPPVSIQGVLRGGETTIEGLSSQFISGLLIACSLADNDSLIHVKDLKSKPYVEMTLQHLKACGVHIHHEGYQDFFVNRNQTIQPRHYRVPADYSSAAFLLAAAFITNSTIEIEGLDPYDVQGDKRIIDIITELETGSQHDLDLGDTPDLLPIVSVLACYVQGVTRMYNVEHARYKESDRISAMAAELQKMGANIRETDDGLIIHPSHLTGTMVNGNRDHRIVMALIIAGLGAQGKTEINNAETIAISYPGFIESMKQLHANITVEGTIV